MSSPEAQKKRLAARERKRKQREKEKVWNRERGAETVSVEMYKGTLECLQELMTELDYDQQAELITRLIHGAHQLMRCDMSQIEQLLEV